MEASALTALLRETAPAERLQTLAQEFADLARSSGVEVRPFDAKRPFERFRQLPLVRQEAILAAFENYFGVVRSQLGLGHDLQDRRKRIFWGILGRLGLRPCSDLFDKLGEDDCVEVYGADFIQIYRNMKFLELCSYNLDDIFACEWVELFYREPRITEALAKEMTHVLSGGVRSTLQISDDAGQAEHVVSEVFLEERREFLVRHKYLSPLFDENGRPAAFVIILDAKVRSAMGAA